MRGGCIWLGHVDLDVAGEYAASLLVLGGRLRASGAPGVLQRRRELFSAPGVLQRSPALFGVPEYWGRSGNFASAKIDGCSELLGHVGLRLVVTRSAGAAGCYVFVPLRFEDVEFACFLLLQVSCGGLFSSFDYFAVFERPWLR